MVDYIWLIWGVVMSAVISVIISVIASLSKNDFFVFVNLFDAIRVNIQISAIAMEMSMTMAVTMTVTMTTVPCWNDRMAMRVIAKFDEIIAAMIRSHWSRRRPEAIMSKRTVPGCLFKPRAIGQRTLRAISRLWRMQRITIQVAHHALIGPVIMVGTVGMVMIDVSAVRRFFFFFFIASSAFSMAMLGWIFMLSIRDTLVWRGMCFARFDTTFVRKVGPS
jgi:hypothetical protein